MARYFKNPNPYAKTLNWKYTQYVLYILVILLALAFALRVSPNSGWFGVFVTIFFLGILIPVYKQIQILIGKNDRGEDGENDIKELLLGLSGEYAVFQNVPIRKHLDIDFVLVGPTGVYAIEVKSYRKYYEYHDGKNFISQTWSEAMGLKEYLKKSGVDIYVGAVLVFSRAYVKFGLQPQRGVYVIGKNFLINLVRTGRPANFDRKKVEEAISKLYLA